MLAVVAAKVPPIPVELRERSKPAVPFIGQNSGGLFTPPNVVTPPATSAPKALAKEAPKRRDFLGNLSSASEYSSLSSNPSAPPKTTPKK